MLPMKPCGHSPHGIMTELGAKLLIFIHILRLFYTIYVFLFLEVDTEIQDQTAVVRPVECVVTDVG